MDHTAVLDRAGALAAEKLKVLKAPEEKAKAEAETKDAATKAQKAEETKKIEGQKIAEAEAKAKDDERIIDAKDEELKEPEKKRKAELLEVKKQKENTPDAKIERVKSETQRRIDELVSEGKARDAKKDAELANLRTELEELKKPKQQENLEAKIKREQAEVQAKYIDEDKGKPKEDRREMSKDELDGWYLEDPVSATEWMQNRTLRRHDDLKKAREAAEEKPKVTAKELADDFVKKQSESRDKLMAKFPSLKPSAERIAELQKKHGNNPEAINSELAEEIPEFKLCRQIVSEDPKKYLERTDGPELVMAEMEKRLSGKSKEKPKGEKIEITEEELQAKIDAEIERRRIVDGEGATSTNGGKKKMQDKKNENNLSESQLRVAAKSKIGTEAYAKMLERRNHIAGAGQGKDETD